MTTMNSNEREPTIKTGGEDLSIFEIMQRYRNDGSCEHVIQDALRMAAGSPEDGDYGATVYNGKGNYTLLAQNAVNRAATRMRDQCVAKVREMRGEWHDQYVAADSSTREALVRKEMLFAQTCAARDIITALESVTLEAAANSVPKDSEGVEDDG